MEGGLTVIAKVLVVTDLHKRWKDSTSIKGQVSVQNAIQKDLIEYCANNHVTHVFIAGDWYDRGFHGLGQAYGAIEMDRRLSACVNGNVYLCVGNHFYLERDENPEMYIIQPNDYIKPQMEIPVPETPIFKLVPKLKLGTVQFDFFHFNKLNKNYVAYRDEDTTYHIGIYHDDTVVPGWVREREGYTGSATQAYFNQIYANVDLAICGHIHTKIGTTVMELNSGRKVPVIIPGSLGITQNKEDFKHADVQLPVITIDDDSTVHIDYATFSTHLPELRFYAPKKKKKTLLSTSEIMANRPTAVNTNSAELLSLPVFLMKRGYTNRHLNLVNAAIGETLNLATAVAILAEVDEIHERTECCETNTGQTE